MKLKFIGCEVLKKEWEYLGAEQIGDCEYLDFDLHRYPEKLKEELQKTILNNQNYDRLVLGYCRCSNMLFGLYSPQTEMVCPTTHDCIGLFLGSTQRHLEYINKNPGTFYLSQGFLDYKLNPYHLTLKNFEEYGEKKGKKLIKLLYGDYNRCLFISTPGIKNQEEYQEYLDRSAEVTAYFKWDLEITEGDPSIMQALVKGQKHPEILLISPGVVVTEDMFKN